MNETQQPEEIITVANEPLSPQGIGMAVAFDWGLAVQILLMPIVTIFFNKSSLMGMSGFHPGAGLIFLFVLEWIVACGLVLFGDMVRQGRNWTRWIQIVVNALLSIVGISSLVNLYQSIQVGNFWPLVTVIILIIFSPLIAWRLSRPATAGWFKTVTVAEARRRHGGKWVWFIALWAIVGGILQTIVTMK